MSNKHRFVIQLTLCTLTIAITGCATTPQNSTDPAAQSLLQLERVVESKKITDARFQTVRGHDYLKVNLALRHQLAEYDQQRDLTAKKQFVGKILAQASRVGIQAIELYLPRLTEEELQTLLTDSPVSNTAERSGLKPRQSLVQAYRQIAEQQLQKDLSFISTLATEKQVDTYWDAFVDHIDESIMTQGRLMRQLKTAPLVPVIKLWIAYHEAIDDRGPHKAEFKHSEIYRPLLNSEQPKQIASTDWALLQQYAPVLVQEIQPDAEFPSRADQFGEISLKGETLEDARPVVNTDKPSVYAYVDEKMIQGIQTKQLVYTFWYTEHPAFSAIDFEAGPMEGWTLRVSLNQANEPMIFESVSNCGCYYKVFPTDTLEAMSQASYSQKLADKNFYIENHLRGQYDAIVPETIHGITSEPHSMALYYSSGHHQLVTIGSTAELRTTPDNRGKSYTLHAYQTLENLPFKQRVVSLFGTDGLVRGAHRLESTVLTPSGVYHAGHPRQRETQMIYFDDAQFDDPRLLETYLRLPPQAFSARTLAQHP